MYSWLLLLYVSPNSCAVIDASDSEHVIVCESREACANGLTERYSSLSFLSCAPSSESFHSRRQPSVPRMFRTSVRRMATAARQTLKIGLIPADGIGREVIPAAQTVLEAIGSDIPKPEFVPLLAGWDLFTRTGTALPTETVE